VDAPFLSRSSYFVGIKETPRDNSELDVLSRVDQALARAKKPERKRREGPEVA
jgi:hypothetical protein